MCTCSSEGQKSSNLPLDQLFMHAFEPPRHVFFERARAMHPYEIHVDTC